MIECWKIHDWLRNNEPERAICPHCWRSLWVRILRVRTNQFVIHVRISSNYSVRMSSQFRGDALANQRTILIIRCRTYSINYPSPSRLFHRRWHFKVVPPFCMYVSQIFGKNHGNPWLDFFPKKRERPPPSKKKKFFLGLGFFSPISPVGCPKKKI